MQSVLVRCFLCLLVVQVSIETLLLGALGDQQQYHFCVCNPPFFGDGEEVCGGVAHSGSSPVPSRSLCRGSSETASSWEQQTSRMCGVGM